MNTKKKEKVTLTHMRSRLKMVCASRFALMRTYHHKYLLAKREGNVHSAQYYDTVTRQARIAAVLVYDLYLEAQGFGYKPHFMKQNDRDLRRYERERNIACLPNMEGFDERPDRQNP